MSLAMAMVMAKPELVSGLSRNDAFVGYSELPATTKLYYGYPQRPKEHLVFATKYGDIRVELQREAAPKTVQYMKRLVNRGLFDGCGLYRAEPSGPTIDIGSSVHRKGYALVQGGLYSCGRQEDNKLPLETTLDNSKGTVAIITGTSEFFFSLDDHHEWNGSFSVFGKVIGGPSWRALERLVALPTKQEVHPSGTVMRILVQPVNFKVTIELQFDPPNVVLPS